jgi:hypothetical protein
MAIGYLIVMRRRMVIPARGEGARMPVSALESTVLSAIDAELRMF